MKTFSIFILSGFLGAILTAHLADKIYIPAAKEQAVQERLEMIVQGDEFYPPDYEANTTPPLVGLKFASVAPYPKEKPPVPEWILENMEFNKELELALEN